MNSYYGQFNMYRWEGESFDCSAIHIPTRSTRIKNKRKAKL
jgi:hypothetical protein